MSEGPASYDARPQDRSGARWALGLSFLPCCLTMLVSIGMAISVLVASRDGLDRGRRLAAGALVVNLLWLGAAGVALTIGPQHGWFGKPTRDAAGHVTRPLDISPNSLREGDCYRDNGPGPGNTQPDTVDSVHVMPCSAPHRFEVYYAEDVPGSDFPGISAVQAQAQRSCSREFTAFVGIPSERSTLTETVLYPTPGSWSVYHDRTITCSLGAEGTDTTGSLRGADR